MFFPARSASPVAAKTRMDLTATPESLHTDYASQVGCYDSVVRARLTDWDGKAVAGISLRLSRDDGSASEGTTDANGVVTWTEQFCDTLFTEEGQMHAAR